MANEPNPDRGTAGPSAPEQPDTTSEPRLLVGLPDYEIEQPASVQQPDSAQLSAGHMGVGSITLAAFAAAVILGVVLYGLNSAPPAPQATAQTASSAPAESGGAANPAPQAGKNGHS
jgi:hypothetical protein